MERRLDGKQFDQSIGITGAGSQFPGWEARHVYKIEVEDDKGLWSDVRGDDGRVLTYETEAEARAALRERFPVLVQMEKYGDRKRTRVIRILTDDDDDWPKRPEAS